ncbi:alpha-2-macroglobulin family protein [Parvularcula flava]|uniref:Alpha-2-macroglobulin n=1 Tax=Aquisalinus luteolus TaxID=1566827 RepID=A0A8J3A0V6_9PROT|nr:alpha-2-macroglobulin [Aquisalinus luteolus]NHK27045.1 alpha-2-macroglobulin family protein [Aquisalinus luteolus]GGH94199.1 alpha-2-macroglobulin [Aquisalinus luteolus]
MQRKGLVIASVFVLIAFAAGLFIGRVGSRPIASGEFAQSGRPAIESVSQANQAFDQQREFETVRADDAPRAGEGAEPDGFGFSRLTLDTSGDVPRACFSFTGNLVSSGDVNYADYVRFEPSVQAVTEVTNNTLCVSGVAFDTTYQATLREGLPGADGAALARAEGVTVAFGDKPAYVGFVGNGVILPRMEADGVGFETVNVEALKISVYRVAERGLVYKRITEGDGAAEGSYGYPWGDESALDDGVKVWEGELPVAMDRNDRVVTVFPLGAALGEARAESGGLKPGAYFLQVEDASEGVDDYQPARAWRWIMFTDMALSAYHGDEGIDLVVRSLETARPLSKVAVKLIARNNEILAEGTTDGDGLVRFPGPVTRGEGALAPQMIVAYGPKDDFAAIDLSRSPLDLSDRNIDGRYTSGAVDSYMWFDRGIYRPGETAHISGMIRDDAGNAVEGRPATLTLRRPNYTEAEVIRIEETTVGGFTTDFAIPSSAPRGMWTATLKVDGTQEEYSESFAVEDFVPQRIAVEVVADEDTPLFAGERRAVEVDARFLYGAPGSGLAVEGDARLRVDPNPFPDYSEFRFGDTESYFNERYLRLGETMTDGAGAATLTLAIDNDVEANGMPLRADLVVGVAEPGGRFVQESARVPVRTLDRYVGVRQDEGERRSNDENVVFSLLALDREGTPVEEASLDWRLIEEDYRFEWYRQNGEWRWRRDYQDILIATGTLDTNEDGLAKLSSDLDYGSYRLEVTDSETGVLTSHRFYSGYSSYASGADTPDQASLTTPDRAVKPGSRAKVTLSAPYAGEATIVVATDRIHSIQRVRIDEGAREINIDTDPSWGGGFYVLATVVTPRDAVDQPVPRRAMGVAYVPFDMDTRTLDLTFDIDDMIRPRQQVTLPVDVDGATAGEAVMMTVAAVDEGILRLTKFDSPDPAVFFFGKKALGVQVYDDYGRLLNPNLAAPTRFGGDQLGGEGLTVVPTKTVALFSGILTISGDGTVDVPLDIPDFNGELRLMAVAWTDDKVGSAAQALTVRDTVPAELALPRFLGPNDTASTTLLIDNVDGRSGVYTVNVDGVGPVSIDETLNVNLAKDQRQDALFSLTAGDVGIGEVLLDVEGPQDFAVQRSYPIQVRAPYFPVTQVTTEAMEAGATYTPSSDLIAGYYPGSTEVTVSFSPLRGIDPKPLLESLYRYPYGCTEQLVSTSFPLLFADELGAMAGEEADMSLRPRVQEAINKILARQSTDGAFGLWRAGDGNAEAWIGAYVTDFLYRAKQQGYAVPETALSSAYDAVEELTSTDRWLSVNYITRIEQGSIYADNQEYLRRRAAAYSFYVLARAGRADLSDLRYFADNFLGEVPSPLARAHAGAALALMGDRARANRAFELAAETIGYSNRENYYQSPLRDVAAMIPLAAEVGAEALVTQLTEDLEGMQSEASYLNTQEKAFLLLASATLLDRAGEVTIAMNGAEATGQTTPAFDLLPADITGEVTFTNAGQGTVYRSVAVFGTPVEAPPAVNEGFTLSKSVFTLDGQSASLGSVSQNDRYVIALSGQPQDQLLHAAVIVDMLPPGFEIESVLTPGDAGEEGIYRWLGDLSYTKVAEARDDRFVAALDVRRNADRAGSGQFALAYVVRAVTPGEYVFPGAVVEDMYRPGIFARTGAGRLAVAPAQ